MSNRALVVIPSYMTEPKDLATTVTAIESVRKTQGNGIDIQVVDDGSPAGALVDGLEAESKELRFDLHRKEENSGFSKTVNIGLQRALEEGRDAILMNADVEITTSGWLERFQATTDPKQRKAAVVGALLLFPNGLIQHCSPGDERVLTHRDGYVPMAELDPGAQGVVSYHQRFDTIHRGERRGKAEKHRNGGYPFAVTERPYRGPMFAIESPGGRARVTPNHKLTAYWTDRALGAYAVYLMRRGDDWRIGKAKFWGGGNTFGPGLRLRKQKGDQLWLLRLCDTPEEAWKYEKTLSWEFGIPTWEFCASGAGNLEDIQARLDDLWATVRGGYEEGVRAALAASGRHPALPLLDRAAGRAATPVVISGSRRGFTTHAANLMPGYMQLPVDAGGKRPTREGFSVDEDHFEGPVYSLDVAPHEHYINEGLVVHNSGIYFSLVTRTFDHFYKYGPGNLPEALEKRVCPVTGAFQFIRHQTLETVGLYDSRFSMGWEDVDYCIRTFLAGECCIYNPNIRGFHHEMMFRGRPSEKVRDWQNKSFLYLCVKYQKQSFAGLVPFL